LVAGIGLSGAVAAYYTFQFTNEDWRLCYKIGAALGVLLLFLRITVAESGMFRQVKQQNIARGNFLMFFTNKTRFRKYILAILIGLPNWFVIGVLINYSNRFATAFYGENKVVSGRAIMYGYAAIAIGDILIGLVSQIFKSRKKALYLFYFFAGLSVVFFFTGVNNDTLMYMACGALGFSTGFWAIFVTMGAEQFGTNLRATAATTIPNMARGTLFLVNLMFLNLFQHSWGWGIIKSGVITGIIIMIIGLLAVVFSEETFHKDLNYVELKDEMP